MTKRILTTPIQAKDLEDLRIGDVVYLTGHITTGRDVVHKRVTEMGRTLPVDIKDGAILHAGPIVRTLPDGTFEMVSVGPTTSMRMERFTYDFVKETGVRLLVGKGGMGPNTAKACKDFKAIHVVFPAGNAVLAATKVEAIESEEWPDLGMPEALWTCRVKEFGPLIVSIDTLGQNLFEEKKKVYNQKKEEVLAELSKKLDFIE